VAQIEGIDAVTRAGAWEGRSTCFGSLLKRFLEG